MAADLFARGGQPALRLYIAEDDAIIAPPIIALDGQPSCIEEDMPLAIEEGIIIEELDIIIELPMDDIVGQAIEDDIIELAIKLDDEAPAAKPGTTWAAIPPATSRPAINASCFFKIISCGLDILPTIHFGLDVP